MKWYQIIAYVFYKIYKINYFSSYDNIIWLIEKDHFNDWQPRNPKQ